MGGGAITSGIAPYLTIGWRNMWRQKRRSLVVISSIAIGISAMIMITAFSNGLVTQMTDNTINTALGHVALHRKGFRKNIKLENVFTPVPQVYAALDGEGSLSGYAPRVTIKGMIRSGEGSRGVLIQGIDPARERGVSRISRSIIRGGGSYLAGPSSDGILISKALAEKLDVYLDDRVVLMFQDRNNELVGCGTARRRLLPDPDGRVRPGRRVRGHTQAPGAVRHRGRSVRDRDEHEGP